MPNIAPATWDAIRRHWRLGTLTPEGLSQRYGLHVSTVRNRAARQNWPKRGSARHDEALMLRVQIDDLWHDLDSARSRLRAEPPSENPAQAQARDRVIVIRQWQRAQAALHDMKARTASAPMPHTSLPTASDDDKAVILDRLQRLALSA